MSSGVELTEGESYALRMTIAVLCSFSFCSCLLVISTHYLYPHLRTNSSKQVVLVALSVLGQNLVALLFLNGGDCTAYAVLTSFFILSSSVWSCMLARSVSLFVNQRHNLHERVVRMHSYAEGKNPLKNCCGCQSIEFMRAAVLHLIVWGVSLGCACAIAVESQNEPVSAWCWFQAVQHGGAIQVATTVNTTQVLLFYTPLVLGMLYNIYVVLGSMGLWETLHMACTGEYDITSTLLDPASWVSGSSQYHQGEPDTLEKSLQAVSVNMRRFVLLSILQTAWFLVAETVNVMDKKRNHITWVFGLLCVIFRLYGVGIAAIYAVRKDVRKQWYHLITCTPNPDCPDDHERIHANGLLSPLSSTSTALAQPLPLDPQFSPHFNLGGGLNMGGGGGKGIGRPLPPLHDIHETQNRSNNVSMYSPPRAFSSASASSSANNSFNYRYDGSGSSTGDIA